MKPDLRMLADDVDVLMDKVAALEKAVELLKGDVCITLETIRQLNDRLESYVKILMGRAANLQNPEVRHEDN